MAFWSRKKKQQEESKGGSVIYRHGGEEFSKSKIGFTEESTQEFCKARESVYGRFFGDSENVFHEVIPLVPHIDVYTYPPGYKGRSFYTLVTSGMSDLAMTLPENAKGFSSRVELIFYCSEPKPEYAELLRRFAHFPHDNNTWLGFWHTIPNGTPPMPFGKSDVLDSFLFMPTIVKPDSSLRDELELDGQQVSFLWLVPLSTPECNFKLQHGMNALLDLFEKHRHLHVFDEKRSSYV